MVFANLVSQTASQLIIIKIETPIKLILCTVRVVQTYECKFLFCKPLGDLFNSVNY